MEYILSESLKKHKNSVARIIVLIFVSVIILNILITLSNNLGEYKNTACILMLIVFGIMIYFIFRDMMKIYSYNLSEDSIIISTTYRNKEKNVLTVNFKNIRVIDKYENILSNYKIAKTRFFIYEMRYAGCYYCEYDVNGKLYRFVFRPSERLIRILERKIGIGTDERRKNGVN